MSKMISIPLKVKKKGGKVFYETDETASDEQRRILRQIQRRKVEVNLSLSWDGVKRPLNSEELETSGPEPKEEKGNVKPAQLTPLQSLEVSSMSSERKLIKVPIKRGGMEANPVDREAKSMSSQKRLQLTSRNETVDGAVTNKSESFKSGSDCRKRAKLARDDDNVNANVGSGGDDDIVEVTLDSVNSSSLDDIVDIDEDDDDIEVVYEKKSQVGCAFCDLFFPNYRLLMLHTARLHKQDAVRIPPTTPGIQCAFCTKGFFDSINLMKHVAVDHPQPGKETTANPKTDLKSKESSRSHEVATDANGNELRENLTFISASVERRKTSTPPTTTASRETMATTATPMNNLTTSVSESSKMFDKGSADDVFQCNHCPHQCSSVEDLLRHNTSVHSKKREQKKVYLCPLCPFIARFRYKVRWQLHFDESHSDALKRSETSGMYECLICRKVDTSKLGLNRHILEDHAETTVIDSRLDVSSTSSESPNSQNVDHLTTAAADQLEQHLMKRKLKRKQELEV